MSLIASQVLGFRRAPPRYGSGTASIVPYKGYATSDGEIVVAAGNDGLFRILARSVGHPEWADDPRFADNPSRVRHQAELYGMLDAIFALRPTAFWLEQLEAAGLPCSPVNDMNQMLAHPQNRGPGPGAARARHGDGLHRPAGELRRPTAPAPRPPARAGRTHRNAARPARNPDPGDPGMNLPDYETVSARMADEHVLLVTLNRPQVGNAINTQMGRDLLDLWNRLTEDAGGAASC